MPVIKVLKLGNYCEYYIYIYIYIFIFNYIYIDLPTQHDDMTGFVGKLIMMAFYKSDPCAKVFTFHLYYKVNSQTWGTMCIYIYTYHKVLQFFTPYSQKETK